LSLILLTLFAGACAGPGDSGESSGSLLQALRLQLDWYAEPAHGGFYQALVKGYYQEEGLDVEILQGGPGAVPLQSVTVGKADFTLGRIDDAIRARDRGLPLMVAMAYMQKDPQAIMYHASNDIETWKDLDGRAIMVDPGGAFVAWLKKRYEIDFDVIPLDFGIARFLSDENFIQQCFITSQPYFAKLQGVEVEAKLLSDESYSPERVVITSSAIAKKSPELIAAFARASIRGWRDYMEGDPEEVHELLLELNEGNTPLLNEYSHHAMREFRIVAGDPEAGESLGLINPGKLLKTLSILKDLELISTIPRIEQIVDYSILPPEISGGDWEY